MGRPRSDFNVDEILRRRNELRSKGKANWTEEEKTEDNTLRFRLRRMRQQAEHDQQEAEEPEEVEEGPAEPRGTGAGRPKSGKHLIEETLQGLAQSGDAGAPLTSNVLRSVTDLVLAITPAPDAYLLTSSGFEKRPNTPIDGELLTERELYLLMFFSHYSKTLSNETFQNEVWMEALKERRRCKTDASFLWETLGKSPLSDRHREWRDFLPTFDPSGLVGNYTEEEIKAWLKKQTCKVLPDVRNRLLMASRDSYKSSFSHVWSLTGTLCCPDMRVMLCSSVDKLSGDFMRKIKFYWTRGSSGCQKFHRLFPEFIVQPTKKSDVGPAEEFQSPCAHLGRPQKSFEATSMESGAAGRRFDIALFDDPINEQTAGSETVRERTLRVFNDGFVPAGDPGSFAIVIGTPYHPQDLYTELIARNEKRIQWAVRRDPAWVVKEHAKDKKIHDLTPEDVTLYFPAQLDWEFLQGKLGTRDNQERSFRRQYLLEWVSDEDTSMKLNFEMPILTKAIIMMAAVPKDGETIISVDTAHTTTNRADLTAMSVMRLFKNEKGDKAVVVLEQRADRWHRNEAAYELAMLWRKWNPRLAIIEKPPYQEELELQIRLQQARYGIAMPVMWAEVDNTKNAKIIRIKSLEGLLPDRLRFASGPWIDALFMQLTNLSGVTRSTQKDDLADSIGLGVRYFRFPLFTDGPAEDEANKKAMEAAKKQADLQANHDRIFGPSSTNVFEPTITMADAEPRGPNTPLNDAIRRTLGGVYHG